MTQTVCCVGECMVEFAANAMGAARLGFGGDTLNTAVYLSRLGVATCYVTALGDDPYSDEMVRSWQQEKIDTSNVLRVAGRLPGLYGIRTDTNGERQFFYWRDQSPARQLFELPGAVALKMALGRAHWIYFSGITLSIFSAAGREAFYALLHAARSAGANIAFDGNFRPRGWPDLAEARQTFARFMGLVTHALPTFEDETLLFGDTTSQATIARIQGYGVREIVLKCGAEGAIVADHESVWVPVAQRVQPLDTTAAGDSFNAGYLAARLAGKPPAQAALRGHRLAAAVIRQRGAIIAIENMPPFID